MKPAHPDDQVILNKLTDLKKEVERGIKEYDFGQTLHKIYDFVWHDLADKYIEASKDRADENVKLTLGSVLDQSLKMLHPFMPFITEELYQRLNGYGALIAEEW